MRRLTPSSDAFKRCNLYGIERELSLFVRATTAIPSSGKHVVDRRVAEDQDPLRAQHEFSSSHGTDLTPHRVRTAPNG
jgi:hypothetical protein